jgi:hypothetical protein
MKRLITSIEASERQPAPQRCQGKHGRADKKQASLTKQVSQAPTKQKQSSGGQQIAVDDPGEITRCKVEITLDRWQRHIHNRVVDHDHELDKAKHC